MELTDDQIIKRVQQGETSAYMTLFERYYPRVERYARRQMQNAEVARDIASETFLRAYRNVGNYRVDENMNYLAYLLMICRRLTITERGRLHQQPMRLPETDEDGDNLFVDDDKPPLDYLLHDERHTMLQEALGHLSEQDREIIHLAFERDLSRRDIMDIMDKASVSAVTSHLHRAMQKLRAIVVRQGYFAV